MTIDERIEKLTERHEALAQTVELWIHETRERDVRTSGQISLILQALDKLTHIAESHERRLDKLEGTA
jgi:hypothetical protein